jgi:hypothetical protein
MFTFVALGIETMAPTGTDGPTMANVIVDMTFSHDLIPQIGWTLLAGAIAFAVTRRRVFALTAMALSLGHWLADLVTGYEHHVFGPESYSLGTDWYHLNLPAALSFEAALGNEDLITSKIRWVGVVQHSSIAVDICQSELASPA